MVAEEIVGKIDSVDREAIETPLKPYQTISCLIVNRNAVLRRCSMIAKRLNDRDLNWPIKLVSDN